MKRVIFISFLVVFILLLFFIYKSNLKNSFEKKTSVSGTPYLENKKFVTIANKKVFVDIAKTPQEKAKGLSGRGNLSENEGMLFIFENKQIPSFWMKDMLIPLDIIWISDGVIIDIDKNVPKPPAGASENQLPIYTPEKPINYVLELNAGFSDRYAIKVGDYVDLSQIN